MATGKRPSPAVSGGAARVPVFDFGGVLFDWNPRFLFRRFFPGDPAGLERFLEEIEFDSWNAGMDRGRPFAEAVEEWSGRFPRYAEMFRAFDTRWEEAVGGPIPGMADLLFRLHGAGYPLYALTNSSAEKIPILRKRFSFLDLFVRIVASGEAGINKPDPRLFAYFLDQTGRSKEEILFIEDTEINVAAARHLGWDTVRFASAARLEAELIGRRML